MRNFKIIVLVIILFGNFSCMNEDIISSKNISEIKIYKSSRRITTDSISTYRIINNKFDINLFISNLNGGEINRYLLLTPEYYITISYPDSTVEIFASKNCFRTKISTYELSQDLSQIIEDIGM